MNVAVLEIEEKEIKLLSARSAGEGIEIVRSETVQLEAGNLAGALGKFQSPDRKVILVVPRAHAILRDFEIPGGEPEEIIQMVRFQVEKELPLTPDQLRYSFVETGRSAGKVRVQVAAVPNTVLSPILETLSLAGFKVDAVTVSTFGLANLVAGKPGPVVVVGMSTQSAEVFVFDGGAIAFSRTAAFPREAQTDDFIENEIQRTMLAFQARAEGRKIAGVVKATTRESLELNGELASREGVLWDSRTPVLAGVCLGAVSKRAPMPDLLHPPVVVKRFKIPKAYRIAGLAVVIVGLVIYGSQKFLSDKTRELEKLRLELKRVEPEVVAVKRKDANVRAARQWREDRYPWLKFFTELNRTKFDKESLQLTNVTFGDKGGITVTGKASTPDVVKAFREELEKMPYLQNVRLSGPLTPINESKYQNKFSLKAELSR